MNYKLTVRRHGKYFGIFHGDTCIATFDSFEKAIGFLA